MTQNSSVVISTRIDVLHALPASILHMRLLAIDNNGERTLGEYTFNNTPQQAG